MDFAVSLSYLQATYIGLVIAMSLKHSYLHFLQDLGAQQLLEKNVTKQHSNLFSGITVDLIIHDPVFSKTLSMKFPGEQIFQWL